MILFDDYFQLAFSKYKTDSVLHFPSIAGLIRYKVSLMHGMMYKSLVVTTWCTWKMCIRIFNILSFSETVFYMSKTWLMLRCLKMLKTFARVLELDMARAVTVPVIVINLIWILGLKKLFYQVWNDTAVDALVFISFPFASKQIKNSLVTLLIYWLKYLHLWKISSRWANKERLVEAKMLFLQTWR